MARGSLQDAIFATCEMASEPIERHQLKWQVAHRLGRIPPERPLGGSTATEAVLTPAFKKSFDRTLRKLHKDGRVELRSWQPGSFDEFHGPYCFKTGSTLVQRLRQQLLPILAADLTHRDPGRIEVQEVELRYIRAQGIVKPVRVEWDRLELRLRHLMPNATPEEAYTLASILIAMARLLEADQIEREGSHLIIAMTPDRLSWSGSSVYDCIRALKRRATTPDVAAFVPHLQRFYPRVVPPPIRARGSLKNELYEFLGGADQGSGYLKVEALWRLHDQATSLVESLPGHNAKLEFSPGAIDPGDYSPYVVYKLLDRIALRGFSRVHI